MKIVSSMDSGLNGWNSQVDKNGLSAIFLGSKVKCGKTWKVCQTFQVLGSYKGQQKFVLQIVTFQLHPFGWKWNRCYVCSKSAGL